MSSVKAEGLPSANKAAPAAGHDDPGVAAAQPLKDSAGRLREAAAAMSKSAARAGVAEDEPLGQMLQSFREMVVAFSDASAGTAERVASTIENTRGLAISEVQKLQQATALATTTIQSLKSAEAVLNLRADQAVSKLVSSVSPDLIKALKTTTVIHQRQWNRRQNVSAVVSVSCLLLGLFGVGYFMGGGDLRSRSDGNFAYAAMERCVQAATPVPITEKSSCPLSSFLEPKK